MSQFNSILQMKLRRSITKAKPGPFQTSKMDHFVTIVNG